MDTKFDELCLPMDKNLSDILLALSKNGLYLSLHEDDFCSHIMWIRLETPFTTELVVKWDLTKKTLSEQEEDTQLEIHEYLKNNNLLKYL